MNKALESKVRRLLLKNFNCGLQKSRKRNWSYNNQLGYMVYDLQYNAVVCGSNFDFTLQNIIKYFKLSV